MSIEENDALRVTDVQRDFLPGGPVVALTNRLRRTPAQPVEVGVPCARSDKRAA